MSTRHRVLLVSPLLVILIAFFLEMTYLAEIQQRFPTAFSREPFCGVDAVSFIERADGLLSGALPGDQTYRFLPGYPLYLAVVYHFFADYLVLPVYLLLPFQLVGLAALYRIGRILFSPLAGILAALGLATYKYYLFYVSCHAQALITTPALLLAVFLLLRFHDRQQIRFLVGAGATLGVVALSRPTVVVMLPMIMLWLLWACYRVSLWQAGKLVFFFLPLVAIIGPFTWHNYQTSGRLVLISDNFGLNIFQSNNPYATGLDILAHDRSQPGGVYYAEILSRIEQGETTFVAETQRFFREQPAQALALLAKKTWLWFGEAEEPLSEPFAPWRIDDVHTLAPLPLRWQALAVAALLGLLLVPGRKDYYSKVSLLGIVYGLYSLATIIFFVQLRIRLPFVPFVILFAAALMASAPEWGRRQPKRFGTVLVVLLILSPLLPGMSVLALLFAGLGLWPYLTRPAPNRYRWVAGGIVVYLTLVGVWTQAVDLASANSQPMDVYLGPPVAGPNILGQTIQVDCSNFNRIEITLGTFNERADQPVTFALATDPSAQQILYSESFDGASVTDYQTRSFSFPPIPDSAGKSYFFFITAPTATPQTAITGRGYTDTPLGRGHDKAIDYYPAGTAFAGSLGNLQPLRADFAFGAYCDLAWWQKIQGVYNHLW
ncbi:MAG TPA: glycosyltransferase family 39 protein [Anaerolineae bacterium]|nr:glycosyltransferase family 39 protein [Anaerolineae bacterium]